MNAGRPGKDEIFSLNESGELVSLFNQACNEVDPDALSYGCGGEFLCRIAHNLRKLAASIVENNNFEMEMECTNLAKNYDTRLKLAKTYAQFGFERECILQAKLWATAIINLLESSWICKIRKIADEFELLANLIWPQTIAVPTTKCVSAPFDFKWWARAETSCRVDLCGGWTDTPPITYQCARPAVLNVGVKVDGQRPIRCYCRRLENYQGIYILVGKLFSGHLKFYRTASELMENCAHPSESGSLICAVLAVSGFVVKRPFSDEKQTEYSFNFGCLGRGLFIQCESDLPHGSGLGTSSILSSAILACLWRMQGKRYSDSALIQKVLDVEQLHTTGGGWQDQVGGAISGGFKLASINAESVGREVVWRTIPTTKTFQCEFEKRLVLVYTGTTRLAKNLLQQVIFRWLRKDAVIREAADELAANAIDAAHLIENGEFPAEICSRYNELKKIFAENSEPPSVVRIKEYLSAAGLSDVAWVAGAGGGGFLYVWLRPGKSAEDVNKLFNSPEWRKVCDGSLSKASTIEIDFDPIKIFS